MAAQDAELKLKVSLDLGFFRQQLAGLGQAAAGYNLPVKIQFDRRSVQNELNALGANIRRRNYRLNIETNLSAEIAKADTLARKLNELSGKIKAASGGAFSRGAQGAAGLEKFMREQGLTGKAFGVQQAQENIARQAILSRLEKKSIQTGGYNVPGLKKIIQDLGGTPTGKREDLVAQAKKLVEESNGIADAVFENLKDLQMKLRPIRGQAQTSAARSMPNLNQMLDRIANLTENPRAAQRMLRMMPESRLSTDLIGAANRQAAFREQYGPQGFRLPGFAGGKAFDPLLKAIAKDFSDYAKTVNITDPWVGQIGDGIRRIVSVSAQAAASTTKALPPIGGTTSPMSALERSLAQSRGTLGTGGGAAASLFTGRGLINPGVSMLSPVGISGGYRQMAAALANQAANPALAHRQIADIGFGAVPTAATGMSGQALNRALNQAFLQRRGLGITGGQTLPIFNAPGVAVQQNIPGMAYRMGGGGLGGSMGVFPTAGMMGPSSPLGRITAQSSMFGGGGAAPPAGGGGGGGMGGLGGFGRAMGGINLPGSGIVREIGEEFGFAAKQVLLFGAAYKALAFIQTFPAQVGEAVSQLQNFRNTLGAISPTAQEAASSNQLILDLVDKYNVPLRSARDGFTKLYASMAPAGFSGDEIRNLFTGITQAAATFGMSADKVDRVNYAFAQMASKGQVMSEELKGQLGDVLPGAMAIFAEAAGFEGPKAIQDFSAALEDGAYKGEAMVALLKNVGVVMNQEFGPGAEGAARTFQGVINRMQNSMTLLYESFEPVAVGFLNTIVVPLTAGIKQISDGLNAFFTGATAKTSGGFGIAQELERLRPVFAGIAQNVQQLIPVFQQFASIALELGKVLLGIAGNPFVGYLLRAYAAVLPLTLAMQALNLKALVPLIASFVKAIPVFITYTAATAQGVTANKALQLAMVTTGKTAGVTATQIRTVGVALKAAFASTAIGAVLLGIGMLIEKIASLNASMADTKAKALGAAQAIRSMSQTEAQQATRQYESGAQSLKGLNDEIEKGKLKGKAWIEVTSQQAKALQDAGVIVSNVRGSLQVQPTRVTGAFQKLQGLAAEGRYRQETLAFEEKQMQQQAVLAPIPPSEKDGKGKKKKELDQYIQDATNALKLEKERQLLAIEDRMLRKEIGESEAKQQSLLVEKLFEEKAVKEALRVATLKNNEANLSAADKALKLSDMQKEAAQELDNIQKKYGIETLKVQLALQEPLGNAISNVNEEITKQAMLGENLSQGFSKLSNDQKAYLDVQAIVREYTDAEKESVADLINEYQKLREEYYANEEALRKRLAMQEKIDEIQMIGGGLRAGFFGQAAGAFEQAMIDSNGDLDYATRMAELETQAMQLRSVFEGLQGAIGGVGQAFGELMTTGVTSLITGTATAKEVFASFLQSVAQALSQAAAQMIATYIAIGLAKMFAGLGGGASADMSKTGISETTLAPMRAYPMANGGVFGPTAFANGGTFTNSIVSGPTMFKFADGGAMNLGLMGEAGPEAIMPLKRGPDGRLGVSMYDASRRAVANAEGNAGVSSIDYEDEFSIGGASASKRSAAASAAQAMTATRLQVMEQRTISERRSEMRQIQEMVAQPAKINVEYQSQVINNVEYVTREQAERMAAQSALRGRELAIGSLQNSVKTRKRVGMG